MKKIALVIVILFFIVQCKNSATNTETINPISCLEKQTTVFSGSELYQVFKNVYENNLLKKVEYYNKENRLLSFTLYTYDSKGILVKITSMDAANNVFYDEKRSYKMNSNNLFSETISESNYSDNTRSYDKYNYFYEGDVLEYETHSSETAKIDSIIYTSYNVSDRPTKIIYFHREFDNQPYQLNMIEKREYDSYHNHIKTEQYYATDTINPINKEIYTYSNISINKRTDVVQDILQYINPKDKNTHIGTDRESYIKENSSNSQNSSLYKYSLEFSKIAQFNLDGCVEKILHGSISYDITGNSTSSHTDTILVDY